MFCIRRDSQRVRDAQGETGREEDVYKEIDDNREDLETGTVLVRGGDCGGKMGQVVGARNGDRGGRGRKGRELGEKRVKAC